MLQRCAKRIGIKIGSRVVLGSHTDADLCRLAGAVFVPRCSFEPAACFLLLSDELNGHRPVLQNKGWLKTPRAGARRDG